MATGTKSPALPIEPWGSQGSEQTPLPLPISCQRKLLVSRRQHASASSAFHPFRYMFLCVYVLSPKVLITVHIASL